MFRTLNIASLFILALFLFTACGRQNEKTAGQETRDTSPQPVLDSTEIERYFAAIPRFKDDLVWAKNFYRERRFRLGWFKDHELVPQAAEMLRVTGKANEEGLNAAHYKVVDLDKLFKEHQQAGKGERRDELEKEIDLALSGTYFNWASDYYRGLVVPRENKELVAWDVKRNKIKLHKALMTILGERKSKYGYAGFQPLHKEYGRLRAALAKYRAIESRGGWGSIPAGTKLKEGQTSDAVPALRKRLAAAGLIGAGSADTSKVYGPDLVAAVKRFQQSLGFTPDGAVGPGTIQELNVPVQERIRQIVLNMERWRWIPKSFEPDYLLVNIPEYRLHVVKNGKELHDQGMNVVVGKTMNSTPVFSDKMETVVFAPYWNVPYSIVDKELRRVLSRDPGYIARSNMEVVNFKGQPISASSINWAGITEKEYNKFILRKKPGPKNDLGDVKFLFPNTDAIYMHDTPHDQLFSLARRDFSHGCVRLEKPLQLAQYLLQDHGWTLAKMKSTIAGGVEKHVRLKEKLPVYIVYFTAWADDAGNVSFRDDIYGHDRKLAKQYFSRL